MKRIVFNGDVKRVTETLEAFAGMHDGMTVLQMAEMFGNMTNEQKERYINLITAEYKQFGERAYNV